MEIQASFALLGLMATLQQISLSNSWEAMYSVLMGNKCSDTGLPDLLADCAAFALGPHYLRGIHFRH